MKLAALAFLVLPLAAAGQTDTDADGVADYLDNCTLLSNPTQVDVDGDYYGNRCDPDFNQDGYVTAADYVLFRAKLNTTDPLYDLNGDGVVTAADYLILRGYLNKPPGPSEPAQGVMSSIEFGADNLGLNPPDATVSTGLLISDWRRSDRYWTGVQAGAGVALELDPRAISPITGINLSFRRLSDPITEHSARWADVWLVNTGSTPATVSVWEFPATCVGGILAWQSLQPVTVPAQGAAMVHVSDQLSGLPQACNSQSILHVRLTGPAGVVVDRVDVSLMP